MKPRLNAMERHAELTGQLNRLARVRHKNAFFRAAYLDAARRERNVARRVVLEALHRK